MVLQTCKDGKTKDWSLIGRSGTTGDFLRRMRTFYKN